MKVDDISKILVVGLGTMGQKIALQCARFGYEVIAYDPIARPLKTPMPEYRVLLPSLWQNRR